MKKPLDVLAVGFGNVGREAINQERLEDMTERLHRELGRVWYVKSNGLWRKDDCTHVHLSRQGEATVNDMPSVDIAFVATPSSMGEENSGYISTLLGDEQTVVVTAEKGAISLNWDAFKDEVDTRLGISATVGGGTQLLRAAKEQMDGGAVSRIDLVANGTLGVVMEEFQKGTVAPTVASLVTKMGYAEPGANSINEVIAGELGDVAKKAQIFFNYVLAAEGEEIDHTAIAVPYLSEEAMKLLQGVDSDRRMTITFARTDEHPEVVDPDQDRLALSISELPGGWTVAIGFAKILDDPVLRTRLQLPGVDAGYVMRAGTDGRDGVYTHSGPGAGALPTARAMHADALRLLSQRETLFGE